MEAYAVPGLITIFSSLFAFYLAYNVGMTRMKHKAPPYEHTTNKQVCIANRTHMNTIENMVVYLPILWVASIFGPSSVIAGGLGALWFISRVWYAFAYLHDTKKRQTPFMIGIFCIAITALLGLYGLAF